MKQLKNPLIIIAFGFCVLFFIPFPAQYTALKIVIALMVISYGISLGAFKEQSLHSRVDRSANECEQRIKEIEKKLAEMEAKDKE